MGYARTGFIVQWLLALFGYRCQEYRRQSSNYTARVEKNIDFTMVDIPYTDIGAQLVVDTPEGRRNLEVTAMPFIDPGEKLPHRPLRD